MSTEKVLISWGSGDGLEGVVILREDGWKVGLMLQFDLLRYMELLESIARALILVL